MDHVLRSSQPPGQIQKALGQDAQVLSENLCLSLRVFTELRETCFPFLRLFEGQVPQVSLGALSL